MVFIASSLLVAVTIFIHFSAAQSPVPECPSPWIPEGNKCYLFSKDRLSWLDAKLFCEKKGALLISINSLAEHSFVNNWFSDYDNNPGNRNQWYTSAYTVAGTDRTNPTFQWLDGTGFGATVFWTDPLAPQTDNGDYVVYKYADTGDHQEQPGYFWVRDAGSVPKAFICEISKMDSDKINSKERDFVFGADNIHPDTLYRGPYFVSQPKDISHQVSVDGEVCTQDCPTVSFDCEARGYPQPTYKWFEDAIGGTVEISAISVNHLTITNGRLTIHNPSRDRDTSTYWCVAENQFGKIRSEKARVNFITLEEFPKNPKEISAPAFDSAVIVCDHPKREGVRYSYKWFKNNDPNDWVNPVYNNHIFISSSGSLYFSSVTDADTADYHCAVSVIGGTESRNSPAYKLIVNTGPSYQDIGPLIHSDFIKIIPKNPQLGDLVYLECFARFTRRSGESAVYTWTRSDGQALPESSELDDYNRRLIIHNVKPEDDGEYVCTVSSQQSSDTKSVALSISAKPFFGQGRLDNQHLDKGAGFQWSCLASGNPPPTYSWLKNTETLRYSAGKISFSNGMKTVIFQNLDKEDDNGMYQCAATNTHGTTYSSAQLRVLEFAPSFEKHPMLGRVLATEDGNATIACDPEAAPDATITWLKDGQPFQVGKNTDNPKRLLPNDYLFLSGITKNVDEGTYTCVAQNNVPNEDGDGQSEARASIQLVVVQRSRLAFGPIDQTVQLGSKVRLECRADFNPILDLVYLWYHNERLIDFDDWKMAQIYSRGSGVNRGDLLIKNITYEERGQFKCTVMTKSDSATLSAVVVVFGPPGEPAGIKATNPGRHTVSVSWSRGAVNGAAITNYIVEKFNEYTKLWVEAKNVNDSSDIASGNTTVDNLFANTGYSFRVRAVNRHGIGVPSIASDVVTTSPDKPTTYPKNITGGGGKEGTLVIRWEPLPREQWNAPNIEYIVQYRDYSDSPGDQGSWSGCNNNQPIKHGDKKTGKCVVTLGRDKFFLPYSIRVYVRNEMGDGPIPKPIKGMSAVKVPTITPTQIVVQPFNATALTVYWDPVPNSREVTGGELSGFHIQYWKASSRQELGRRNTILGNVTEGMIIGLEPATDYMVTAQLFNSAGDAPPGRNIPQTTWFNAPLNMPEYVTLNKTGERTVGVHFRGIVTGTNEEPLDGYKVRIWRQGESLRNAKDYDCGRRTWIIIDDNFESNEIYNLRVFGYSRGGVGKMSSPLIQFTIGCSRQQTSDVTEVQWVYLCSNGCNKTLISSYTLFVVLLWSLFTRQFV